eukprot:9306617-Pyramimonas_sp.AAC.1
MFGDCFQASSRAEAPQGARAQEGPEIPSELYLEEGWPGEPDPWEDELNFLYCAGAGAPFPPPSTLAVGDPAPAP